jgi:alkylated DNA repair protein (DNA oxidative demethylase)
MNDLSGGAAYPMRDLFDGAPIDTRREPLAPGAWLLHGYAHGTATSLIAAIEGIAAAAPFRHWVTPGGFRMSVAMTNCGPLGWISDRRGYRYDARDPQSGRRWPPLPPLLFDLAQAAAEAGGFGGFEPDACLINRYTPGARLTLHQDKDEQHLKSPIVSVSLGLPATFLFGGDARSDKQRRVPLQHGDVVVWGGAARLHHHGVLALREGCQQILGRQRLNLTFRRAG